MANGPVEEISLNPVSYVVLGFADQWAAELTSYDLKQMVAGSVGYFWPFPHSQLYAEPARLAGAGYLDEEVETGGRRRRLYRITPRGREALRAWLAETAGNGTEVRDLGLLKLFFAAAGSTGNITRLADEQRTVHEQNLAGYSALHESICDTAGEWELATLDLGRRFEQMAIDFWADVGSRAQGRAQGRAAPMRPRR
jgi:PadR family transcriptional regulator, regulatory protein AphA